jgi:RNA polymerase sigma-70 factor (ECF subfamily)
MSSSNPPDARTAVHADLALVAECQRGVPGAFDRLYRRHAPRLFSVARRLVGPTEAEDLLQEIFLSAHRKFGLYRGESSLGTEFCGVVHVFKS